MKNKKLIIVLSVIAILVLTIGLSFAFFTYNKVSINNSSLVVGDIYMHYNETNEFKIEGAMPSSTYDPTKYFEFTIDGKNTHTKNGILYNIQLVHGNDEANKTRIEDKFLKFRLVSVDNNQETVLQDKLTIDNINNTTIYNSTIPANTTTKIVKTYRLYMWIDENVNICSGDQTGNCDYTLTDWEKLFASVKVNVNGKYVEATNFVEAIKNRYNGSNQDGLVAVNTAGDLATTSDTIREYRYSGIGNYCTYTDGTNDYNLSVSGSTCPQTACYVSNDNTVMTSENDLFNLGDTCNDIGGTTINIKNNQTTPTDSGIRNYVKFNNETWRIVGVFNEENASGEKAERIKLVKDEPISASTEVPTTITKGNITYQMFNPTSGTKYKYFYWNNPSSIETNKNDWTKAGSMYYLNENYLNSLENSTIIENMKYYLGGLDNGTLKEIYTMERDESNILENNQATWNGKIALLYPSDLGYARISSGWSDAIINNINYNNWMLNDQTSFRLLSPYTKNVSNATGWISNLGLYWYKTDNYDALRPVLSLGSQAMIISGSGSIDDPYILSDN
mgnify:CR=1 FL=1